MGPDPHSKSFPGHCVASGNEWFGTDLNTEYIYDIDSSLWVSNRGAYQYGCYSIYQYRDQTLSPFDEIIIKIDFDDPERESQTHSLTRDLCSPCFYYNEYFEIFVNTTNFLMVGCGNPEVESLQGFVTPPEGAENYPILPNRYYAKNLDELMSVVNEYNKLHRWRDGDDVIFGLREDSYTMSYELPEKSSLLLYPNNPDTIQPHGSLYFRKSISGWDFVRGSDTGNEVLYRSYPEYSVSTGIYTKNKSATIRSVGNITNRGQIFTDVDRDGSRETNYSTLMGGDGFFSSLDREIAYEDTHYGLTSAKLLDLRPIFQDDKDDPLWNIEYLPHNVEYFGSETIYFTERNLGNTQMVKPCVKAHSQIEIPNAPEDHKYVEPEFYITPPEDFTIIQKIGDDKLSISIYNCKSSPYVRYKRGLTQNQLEEINEHSDIPSGKIGVTTGAFQFSPFKFPLASPLEDTVSQEEHVELENQEKTWLLTCTNTYDQCSQTSNLEGLDMGYINIDAPLPPWELTATVEIDPDEFVTENNYSGWLWDERTQSLSGPFLNEDVTAIATRDNSSEMYCVTADNKIKRTDLLDFNEPNFKKFTDPFTKEELAKEINLSEGIILSKKGEGFAYKNRYLPTPFGELTHEQGEVIDPLYFKDSYLSVIETNWIHLGDEHNEKQVYRVDLSFHKNSCGHLWCYVQNDEDLVKGQYKGAIKDHLKVFTNLRGRRFKVKLLIATHNKLPWAMREMSIGHLYGKSF